jgi:hypothetical protein
MAAVPGISLQPAATPTAPTDLVYALHDFVRENIDELSFSAGEAIGTPTLHVLVCPAR